MTERRTRRASSSAEPHRAIARTVLLAILTLAGSAALPAQDRTATVTPETIKVEDAARAAVAAYVDAWNAADAAALAQLYTAYADYTGFGSVMTRGRGEIESRYASLLNGQFHGTRLAMAVSSIRLVGSGVAVIDGSLELTGAQGPNGAAVAPAKGLFIAIMTQEEGAWRFTTFWSKRLQG